MSDKRSIENEFMNGEAETVTPIISFDGEEADRSRAERNADEISRLMQERRERGEVSYESEETPVKRTDVSEIDMELTGKIIAQTGAFERVTDIPNDLSSEERAKMLAERRKKKVDAFICYDFATSFKSAILELASGKGEKKSFYSFDLIRR